MVAEEPQPDDGSGEGVFELSAGETGTQVRQERRLLAVWTSV